MKNKGYFNLNHLSFFCDAVHLGSQSLAAKKNFVCQSAVGQAISKLEDYFEVSLITHQRNRFQVTLEGKKLLASSKKLWEEVENLRANMALLSENELHGEVKLGASASLAKFFFPKLIEKLSKRHPSLVVNVVTGRLDMLKDMLKKDQLRAALVLENENLSNYSFTDIYEGTFGIYYNGEQCPKEVLSQPIMVTELERNEVLLLSKWQKDLRFRQTASSWEIIKELAACGMGAGLFPDYLLLRDAKLGLKKLKAPILPYRLGLIRPPATKENFLYHELLKEMRKLFLAIKCENIV